MLITFQPDPSTSSLERAVLTPATITLIYWFIQNSHFRYSDGSTLFQRTRRDLQPEFKLADVPMTILLLAVPMVAALLLSLVVAATKTDEETWGMILFLALYANAPVAYSLFTSNELIRAHRASYIARRNARRDAILEARKEAEELRRKQALIVPPKPPVTFESRLNDITTEHQERMRQLGRLQIDPQEREYLIELQQARYLEQVRTLTDPSLGPQGNDGGHIGPS
ncbi:MAG: hypothetical protein R3C59_20780 [Planctomycetaceae bacterium]